MFYAITAPSTPVPPATLRTRFASVKTSARKACVHLLQSANACLPWHLFRANHQHSVSVFFLAMVAVTLKDQWEFSEEQNIITGTRNSLDILIFFMHATCTTAMACFLGQAADNIKTVKKTPPLEGITRYELILGALIGFFYAFLDPLGLAMINYDDPIQGISPHQGLQVAWKTLVIGWNLCCGTYAGCMITMLGKNVKMMHQHKVIAQDAAWLATNEDNDTEETATFEGEREERQSARWKDIPLENTSAALLTNAFRYTTASSAKPFLKKYAFTAITLPLSCITLLLQHLWMVSQQPAMPLLGATNRHNLWIYLTYCFTGVALEGIVALAADRLTLIKAEIKIKSESDFPLVPTHPIIKYRYSMLAGGLGLMQSLSAAENIGLMHPAIIMPDINNDTPSVQVVWKTLVLTLTFLHGILNGVMVRSLCASSRAIQQDDELRQVLSREAENTRDELYGVYNPPSLLGVAHGSGL